jgi:hypothetical protein
LIEKVPEGEHKIKDFEFDRILYTREALLHFFNTQMLLHAQAFNTYSGLFDKLTDMEEA